MSKETEVTIRPPIKIVINGDKCGDSCKSHKYYVDSMPYCKAFPEYNIKIELEKTGDYGIDSKRCQACIDAEREDDTTLNMELAEVIAERDELQDKVDLSIAELGALEEQVDIRDKGIKNLVDALETLLELDTDAEISELKRVALIVNQALESAKELVG